MLTITRKTDEYITLTDEETGRVAVVVVKAIRKNQVRISLIGTEGIVIQRSREGTYQEHRRALLKAVNNPEPGPIWTPDVFMTNGLWRAYAHNRITGINRGGQLFVVEAQAVEMAASLCAKLNKRKGGN